MSPNMFTPGQLVKARGRNATVVDTEDDGVHVIFDDAGTTGPWSFFPTSEVSPRSIKKSHRAEGKNFLD
jgi:hypothetical protein